MTFGCEHVRERLSARLDHQIDGGGGGLAPELSDQDLAAIDAHLAGCADCTAIAEALTEARGLLTELGDVRAPEGFAAAVGAAVRETPQDRVLNARWRAPVRMFASLGLAAGVIGLAVLIDRTPPPARDLAPANEVADSAPGFKRPGEGAKRVADGLATGGEGALQQTAQKNLEHLDARLKKQAEKQERHRGAPARDLAARDLQEEADAEADAASADKKAGDAPAGLGRLRQKSKSAPAPEPEEAGKLRAEGDGGARGASLGRAQGGAEYRGRNDADDADDAVKAEQGEAKSAARKAGRRSRGGRAALEKEMAKTEKAADRERNAPDEALAESGEQVVYLVARVAPDSAEARRLLAYLGANAQPGRTAGFAGPAPSADPAAPAPPAPPADEAPNDDAGEGRKGQDGAPTKDDNGTRFRNRADELRELLAKVTEQQQNAGKARGKGEQRRGSMVEAVLPATAWERLQGGVLDTIGLRDRVTLRPAGNDGGAGGNWGRPPAGPVGGGAGGGAAGGKRGAVTAPQPAKADGGSRPGVTGGPTGPSGPTNPTGPTGPSAPAKPGKTPAPSGPPLPGAPTGPSGPSSGPSAPTTTPTTPTGPATAGPAPRGTPAEGGAAPGGAAAPSPKSAPKAAPNAAPPATKPAQSPSTGAPARQRRRARTVRVIVVFEPPAAPAAKPAPAATPKAAKKD